MVWLGLVWFEDVCDQKSADICIGFLNFDMFLPFKRHFQSKMKFQMKCEYGFLLLQHLPRVLIDTSYYVNLQVEIRIEGRSKFE